VGSFIGDAWKEWNGRFRDDVRSFFRSEENAFGAEMVRYGLELHLILNAFWEGLDFELPQASAGEPWRRWIDTSLDSPDDIVPWQEAPSVADHRSLPSGAAIGRGPVANARIRPHLRSRAWPVDASTLLQSDPSGSIFLRAETAREMGTWVNWWFQKPTTMFVRPLMPACTALCPRSRQNAES
jgi:hypothetical protein